MSDRKQSQPTLPKIRVVVNGEESEVSFQDVTGDYSWIGQHFRSISGSGDSYQPQETRNTPTRVLRIYGNQTWLSGVVSGRERNVLINIDGVPYRPLHIPGFREGGSSGYVQGLYHIDIEESPREKQSLTVEAIISSPTLLKQIAESENPIGEINKLVPNLAPEDRLKIMRAAAPKE